MKSENTLQLSLPEAKSRAKTLAARITTRIQRGVSISAALSVAIVLGYGAISSYRTGKSTATFAQNYLRSVSASAVIASDTISIQKDLQRFVETYAGEQDIDLDVSVILDGRLVAQAKTVSFDGRVGAGLFAELTTLKSRESSDLPNGMRLEVDSVADFYKRTLGIAMISVAILVAAFLASLLLRRMTESSVRSVTQPLEERIRLLR